MTTEYPIFKHFGPLLSVLHSDVSFVGYIEGDHNLIMTTAKELEHHCHTLQNGLIRNVSGSALNQLVENVTHALTNSLANGDTIRVAGIDQRLTTRLQILNALDQGFMIEATPAPQVHSTMSYSTGAVRAT